MNELFQWILTAGVGLILLLFGIEKRKTAKATKRAEQAEDERDQLKVANKVYQDIDKIKDELAEKKAKLAREEKEVIQSISEIPEEKEEELSDEVKKLAADQSARARAEQLQNDRNKN